MEPIKFLDAVAGYVRSGPTSSAGKPIRLATIDPSYQSFGTPYPNGQPPARVTFEGESTLSGKYYPVVAGFIPAANQRVYMVPIGTTYLIAGSVAGSTTQGFYDGPSYSGIEFGDGNYFDTLEGLQLETDADIGGALAVGGPMDVGTMRFVDNEKIVSGLLASGTNSTTSFVNVPAPSSMSFTKKYSGTYTKIIIYLKLSLRISVGTGPQVAKIAVNVSGGSGDHEVDHEVLQTSGEHYPMVGLRELTGFAAGTYTIQARYRPVNAGVSLAIDSNDYITLHVREVSI